MAIYNGSQKINMPGIAKVYVGSTLVYQKQTPTLYRKLEYLHTNGTNNYIDTGIKPVINRNNYCQFKYDTTQTGTNNHHIMSCSGDNISGRGRMRWISYFNPSNSHFYYRVGRDGVTDTQCSLAFNSAHKYEARHKVYDVSTGYRHWESFMDLDTGQDVGYYFNTNTNVYTYTPANMPNIALMAYAYDNQLYYNNNFMKGYLYRYYRREGSDTAPIDVDMYPAQRKSDNVVGMYETLTNTFIPMGGTQDSSSAGPVVDENPEGWL